jgi:hypothetical protein
VRSAGHASTLTGTPSPAPRRSGASGRPGE